MNTYKTTRGIEFYLEVIGFDYKSVEVMATCEEGVNYFYIDFDLPIKEDENLYARLLERETDDLVDMLDEVNAWVDQVTIASIASDAANLCVEKSINGEYWNYSIFHDGCLNINIHQMRVIKEMSYENIKSHFAYNETEIKELINKLK